MPVASTLKSLINFRHQISKRLPFAIFKALEVAKLRPRLIKSLQTASAAGNPHSEGSRFLRVPFALTGEVRCSADVHELLPKLACVLYGAFMPTSNTRFVIFMDFIQVNPVYGGLTRKPRMTSSNSANADRVKRPHALDFILTPRT